MNPQRALFGRVTINGKRTDLGRAILSAMFIRAAQVFTSTPSKTPDINIIIELSTSKLPDSSILNKEAIIEQSLVAQIVTDPTQESPFEGITIGRVQEAMASPEYEAWAHYCLPDNRVGVDPLVISVARGQYDIRFPDCASHFPKWIES